MCGKDRQTHRALTVSFSNRRNQLLLDRFQFRGVVGRGVGLLQAIPGAGADVILLQVFAYELDVNRAPTRAGIGLGIIAERVEVGQILLDKGKRLLFIPQLRAK